MLQVALRAHGFHPPEAEPGVPGLPGVTGPHGFAIEVPEAEAEDAAVLAQALIAEFDH